jgi:hypothetical protein
MLAFRGRMDRRLGCLLMMLVCSGALDAAAQARNSDDAARVRRALERTSIMPASARLPEPASKAPVNQTAQEGTPLRGPGGPGERRDSVWNGALIGAAIGGVGGYVWARNICGGTGDTECFVISAPVGILGGIGIGAAIGAVADAVHK